MRTRLLCCILLSVIYGTTVSYAQRTTVSVNEFSGFRKIDIGDSFDVSVVRGEKNTVKLSVDELISEYVSSYVKDNTLYVDLDEKSFSPELKKTFRGKNAIVPVMRAEITVKYLDTLYLHEKAVLDNAGPLFSDDSVSIVMDGNSMISNLTFKGELLTLDMSKSSSADIVAEAGSLSASLVGAATMNLKYNTETFLLNTTGSASAKTAGESEKCSVYSESSSEIKMEGKTSHLNIVGRGMSVINADALETSGASVSLAGPSHCIVDAADALRVDISGGSHLIFNGSPALEIVRVLSSSLTRPGDTGK